MTKEYQWSNAHDWLDDHVATADITELRSVIRDLASKVSGDDIQDLFQAEMDADHYFTAFKTWTVECHRCSAEPFTHYGPEPVLCPRCQYEDIDTTPGM